ncbi:MAG: TMEM165/GDT1 family protein [Jatrophihabitantaceae bacterium]
MFNIAIIATVFALIFVGELPDKTAVAGLVLGSRFPWRWVFTGIAAAFLTHVTIAVSAGSLLILLPHRIVESVVALVFLLGAVLVWREGVEDEAEEEAEVQAVAESAGFWKVAGLGYAVIFVAEWGDLTQILTANLAAKYHNPLSVGLGAVLGLWSVGLLAILGGKTLLKVLPIKWITRIAAVVMTSLGIYSIVQVASWNTNRPLQLADPVGWLASQHTQRGEAATRNMPTPICWPSPALKNKNVNGRPPSMTPHTATAATTPAATTARRTTPDPDWADNTRMAPPGCHA